MRIGVAIAPADRAHHDVELARSGSSSWLSVRAVLVPVHRALRSGSSSWLSVRAPGLAGLARTSGRAWLATLVASAMVLAACRSRDHAAPVSNGSGTAPPASVVPHLPSSTNGRDELLRIDQTIERNTDQPALAIGALLDRATYLGRLDDYGDALDRAAAWVERAPNDLEANLARVRTLTAVHEFAAARTALDAVKHLATDPSQWHDAALALDDATGARDHVLADRADSAHAYPSTRNLTLYAADLAVAGRFDEASALVPRAAAALHDNSALLYGWLLFQWGRVYELNGDLGAARQFYAEACARLPGYVEATAHLAQTALAIGDRDAATRTVKDALVASHHPALLELGVQLGLTPLVEARGEWDRYVAALPRAFADHAARFYLGVGADPKRALDLAQQNLANRDVPEARALVVEAALAAKDDAAACAVATPLAAAPLRTHRFMAWRALSRPSCKSGDIAARLAKDLGIDP